jgi:hypothetical protein
MSLNRYLKIEQSALPMGVKTLKDTKIYGSSISYKFTQYCVCTHSLIYPYVHSLIYLKSFLDYS